MPCSDGGPSREQIEEQRLVPAILCGVLSALERSGQLGVMLAETDWAEVGCARAYAEGWWAEHKRRDAERRQWEAETQRKKDLRAAAIAKLTPEERDAIKGY